MVSTIPPMLLALGAQLADGLAGLGRGVADGGHGLGGTRDGLGADAGGGAGLVGGARGLVGVLGRSGGGAGDLLGLARAEVAERTWRSAPAATSPSARAISSTARPASADDEATSCEAPATLVAERDIWLTAVAQIGDEAGEGGAEAVALGARRHVDGQVAGGHAVGGAGQRAQVVDHRGQGAGGATDLVARP